MSMDSNTCLHIGNDDDDTSRVDILLGKTSQDNFIGRSTDAYKEVYKRVGSCYRIRRGSNSYLYRLRWRHGI